jgi:4-phospho-D-threonate 3-dehydrogenase / 4-phospho-D-erythronate 3-dehydrogenase
MLPNLPILAPLENIKFSMSESNPIKIGITIGDINGIGPEVIIKTLRHPKVLDYCIPIVYGAGKVISYYKNIIKADDFLYHPLRSGEKPQSGKIYVINTWQENVLVSAGKINDTGGRYALMALDHAIQDCQAGFLDGLVTAPIHKQAMQLAGFKYTGHTDYLADKLQSKGHMMMMVGNFFKLGLLTTHIPLQEVPTRITAQKLKSAVHLLSDSLQQDFGIDRPVIAVLGLNPHAGDGGVIGQEEVQALAPAIQDLKNQGYLVTGPLAADGFFGSAQYKKYDGVLAMYHDQGLIPFKALEFDNGVNFTAGLPVVRTSPDHGTAFDIAGQNLADPTSFRAALFGAIDIARQRKKYLDDRANQLRKHQKVSEEKVEG